MRTAAVAAENGLAVTFFTDYAATRKREQQLTLPDLAELIRTTSEPAKDQLPWLKLARFGNARTEKGSLRHDRNLIAQSGIEADYDGGLVGFDAAVERAEKAGLRCILYTSPSHRPETPRWRILCPTSNELPPAQRAHMLARINGLYHGIFAVESWTLSQSYYYGAVNHNPAHQVALVDGLPIDELDELDKIAIGKPGTKGRQGNGADPATDGPVDEPVLLKQIKTGKSYHTAVTRLVGLWATRGVPMMEAKQRLTDAFNDTFPPDRDARWHARFADIDRILLDIYAKQAEHRDEKEAELEALQQRQPPLEPDEEKPPLWNDTRLSDWADREISPRPWIMEEWIPVGQCVGLYGVGGVLKTDWLVQLLMAASLGLPFCGIPLFHCKTYGLFCEDTEDEIARRAQRIAGFYGRSLSEFTGFKFASLVGVTDTEFLNFDTGRMILQPAYHFFAERIADHGAMLAALDTAPDFFGGEEINRRQVSRFFRVLDGVANNNHCGIIFSAHPSQRGRQSGRLDSGSTGWEGKVRARLTLHDPVEDGEQVDTPKRVVRPPSDKRILTRAKSNYAKPGVEIELVLRDGAFASSAIDPQDGTKRGHLRDMAADAKFLELLRQIKKQGRYVHDASNSPDRYAPNVFYSHPDRGDFSKPELKRAMQRLFNTNRIKLEWVATVRHNEIVEV